MRLVIHIGSHKAGSTSIQHYCFNNRETLRSHGIEYPTGFFLKYPQQHSEIVSLLRDKDRDGLRKFFAMARPTSIQHVINTTFLSGEDLCTLERHHVSLLHQVALDYFSEIKIILILRNKREYYWSAYKFNLLRGAPLGEMGFRRQHFFSPAQCIEAWSGFDRMHIQVHNFDSIKDKLLTNFFEAAMEVSVTENVFENVSLDYLTSIIYNTFLKAYDENHMAKILYGVNSRHRMIRFPIEDVIADDINLEYPDHDWEILTDQTLKTLVEKRTISAGDPEPVQVCDRVIETFQELRASFKDAKDRPAANPDFFTKLYLRRQARRGRSLKDLPH